MSSTVRILWSVFLLLSLGAFNNSALAKESKADGTSKKASGADVIEHLPPEDWSKTENWAWEQIKAGKIANFSLNGHRLRPAFWQDWRGEEVKTERALRSAFLETILLCQPFKSQIPHDGVHIIGALFLEEINLKNSILEHELILEESRFERSVDLSNLKSPFEISFQGSVFEQKLTLSGARVGGDLVLDDGRFEKLDLRAGQIDGQLTMDRAKVLGSLKMQSIFVGSQFSAQQSRFDGSIKIQGALIKKQMTMEGSKILGLLALHGARIEGRLNLADAEISGPLKMRGARIGTNLNMQNGKFSSVDLTTAKVAGQVQMSDSGFSDKLSLYGLDVGDMFTLNGATVHGELHFQGAHISSKVSMQRSTFKKEVSFKGANIGGDLYLDGASFADELDMHRVTIDGTLIFKAGEFKDDVNIDLAKIDSVEYKGAKELQNLNLKGTSVNKVFVKVKDTNDWPIKMDLHGFTYNLFWGEYEGVEGGQKDFFKAWLERLKKYSPQPYEQCAKVLREAGFPERANDVLYAGKEKERHDALVNNNFGRWLWLSILKLTIGYGLGLRYFRALWWAGLFILIGGYICFTADGKRRVSSLCDSDAKGENGKVKNSRLCLACLFYSFDMLLPIIKLRSKHDRLDLPCPQRLYFYFHQMTGWLLVSFILAGLAGITQG